MEIADRKSITELRHSDPSFRASHFRSLNTLSYIVDKVSVPNTIIDSLAIHPDDSCEKEKSFSPFNNGAFSLSDGEMFILSIHAGWTEKVSLSPHNYMSDHYVI